MILLFSILFYQDYENLNIKFQQIHPRLDIVKFIYSEKATKFCEISALLLSVCTVDKSQVDISQNFVAFSEYTNFTHFSLSTLGLQ